MGESKTMQDFGAFGRRRPRSRGAVWVAIIACVILLAAVVPSPYSVESPGPVVNTLGEVQIEDETMPVISIPERETYPTTGELNLLTVSIQGSPDHPLSWLGLVPALLDPTQRIAPRSNFYPEGSTLKDREAQGTMQMQSSQAQAAAAAFRELGEDVPVTLVVAGVSPEGPAQGVLQESDELLAAAGQPVTDFGDLRTRITATPPGAELALQVRRDGAEQTLALVPAVPEGGSEPLIGAVISTQYELPADVMINLSEIGGPSAGMMFSLAIIDQLTPGPMLEGMAVSGTGTVTDQGEIGPIGGLEQKMWAAERAGSELFLMPQGNCGDLPAKLPPGLQVVPVETLSEARDAVDRAVAGETVHDPERCTTPAA